MSNKWEIQTQISNRFENCWRDGDKDLVYFNTREEARAELKVHKALMKEKNMDGDIYRIRKVPKDE